MRTELTYDAPLKELNTFGIQAKARMLLTYDSEASLREALSDIRLHHSNLPMLHIGCGSNLLFLGDYPGIVLRSAIRGIHLLGETTDEVLVPARCATTSLPRPSGTVGMAWRTSHSFPDRWERLPYRTSEPMA